MGEHHCAWPGAISTESKTNYGSCFKNERCSGGRGWLVGWTAGEGGGGGGAEDLKQILRK